MEENNKQENNEDFQQVPQRRPRRGRGRGRASGRGRGRGRGSNRPAQTDFSLYQLREVQKGKIEEWLQRAAEEWFESLTVSPELVCAPMAHESIYAIWWNGLVQQRLHQGLEIDPSRSALMFRSVEHTMSLFATCPWLQFVVNVADPWFLEGNKDTQQPVIPEGSILPNTVVTAAAATTLMNALNDKAIAFIGEYNATHKDDPVNVDQVAPESVPTGHLPNEGTWWKEDAMDVEK